LDFCNILFTGGMAGNCQQKEPESQANSFHSLLIFKLLHKYFLNKIFSLLLIFFSKLKKNYALNKLFV